MDQTYLDVLEAQIVLVLRSIPDFKKVYDHEPLELFELPAASIFYSGFEGTDILMPNAIEVKEKWILRLYLKLDDAKVAQDQMKNLITRVRKAFRVDRDLSGRCLYTQFHSGEVFAVINKDNSQLVAEINLMAVVEEMG